MKAQHASFTGFFIGLLLGFVMTVLRDIAIVDAILRIAALAGFGALMPALLTWLDNMLREKNREPTHDRKEIQP